jgi:hypothetical protein
MIKNITPAGRYIRVSGNHPGTYINNYSGAQGIGNMRFNTAEQRIEIWDGNSWRELDMQHVTVGLDPEAVELLDWAKAKYSEESRIKELAQQHPGIQDLQQKLDIMIALVNQDQHE